MWIQHTQFLRRILFVFCFISHDVGSTAVYVAVTAKRGSFFPHGLGDINRYDKALERFRTHAHEPPVELRLEEWTVSGSAQAAMGSFASPVAEFLPNEKNIHTAHFQIIVPAAGGLDAAIEAGPTLFVRSTSSNRLKLSCL